MGIYHAGTKDVIRPASSVDIVGVGNPYCGLTTYLQLTRRLQKAAVLMQ